MSEWATGVLNDSEIAEYDQAVNGTDPKVAKLAVQALWNRYRAEADIQPQVQLGRGQTSQQIGEGYPNMDAYVRDTMRPEYANDPAYRAKVDAIAIDGAPTADYTLGDTGIVTFDNAPADGSALTWTGTFAWLCRLEADVLDVRRIMQGLWETGDAVRFSNELGL